MISPTRPSRLDLTLEIPRASVEMAGFLAATPVLRSLPRGDGHPVLVLPGFLADDTSTLMLRQLLGRLGYAPYGWRLGRNLGPTDRIIDGISRSVGQLSERHAEPMSLVGWSLGGIFARELARLFPDVIRQVISLGSPFNMADLGQSRASDGYRRLEHLHDGSAEIVTSFVPSADPLPVPSSAVYTRNDGIVAWWTCVQRSGLQSENIEVRGSHCGLGHNPAAALAIADRLARPAGAWTPFRARRRHRLWFPTAVDGPPAPIDLTPAHPEDQPWTA